VYQKRGLVANLHSANSLLAHAAWVEGDPRKKRLHYWRFQLSYLFPPLPLMIPDSLPSRQFCGIISPGVRRAVEYGVGLRACLISGKPPGAQGGLTANLRMQICCWFASWLMAKSRSDFALPPLKIAPGWF
jgi:hypothetical protein